MRAPLPAAVVAAALLLLAAAAPVSAAGVKIGGPTGDNVLRVPPSQVALANQLLAGLEAAAVSINTGRPVEAGFFASSTPPPNATRQAVIVMTGTILAAAAINNFQATAAQALNLGDPSFFK